MKPYDQLRSLRSDLKGRGWIMPSDTRHCAGLVAGLFLALSALSFSAPLALADSESGGPMGVGESEASQAANSSAAQSQSGTNSGGPTMTRGEVKSDITEAGGGNQSGGITMSGGSSSSGGIKNRAVTLEDLGNRKPAAAESATKARVAPPQVEVKTFHWKKTPAVKTPKSGKHTHA